MYLVVTAHAIAQFVAAKSYEVDRADGLLLNLLSGEIRIKDTKELVEAAR
jgi:hypothetical protein